ncbi:hypothetical protein RclHR1_20680002 [Rhizophagus clarus]|uniref:DUF7431 domain-containing protein n=1 Tax=Rhizophagus clarus TaxID=94130 RepID=A0A2Z6R4Z4_9GLOM|nr:hypothetical protein RclHR1_20680002 [Rhizophagus clarus]GES95398.1 hypothetical protein GLOIN_2v1483854 [Rhizophagus clarus]
MVNIDSKGFQNEIINADSIIIQDYIKVTVQIDDPSSKLVLVNLNLKDNLSKIRKRLEQNSKVKMNNTLTFAYKISQTNNTEGSLAEIAREDEENIILEEIVEKKNNILYLNSEPDWRFLKDKHKLEYGRTLNSETKKRVVIIEECEMTEIIDGCKNSFTEIDSEADQIIRNDFILNADTDVHNFAKLKVSFGNSKIERSNFGINSTCIISEYNKVSLKFKLKPDLEFIEKVKDAIKSEDPINFKKINEEFGYFISQEVNLGGKAYFKKSNISSEHSEENYNKYDISALNNIKIENSTENLKRNNNNSKHECFKLIGGPQLNLNNFDEKTWVESLKDFRNWSCIKFKDSVNIFQVLSEDLRKQILLLVGKKILYTNTEDYTYYLSEPGMHQALKLNIPENILKILRNKDADCSIFATIIDKKEKDIFNCQIIWPPNEDPRLVIHCIQKKFKGRECKLKIRWMIVGYDINFDFNRSDLNVKLKILKNEFNATNDKIIVKPLELEYDLSILCFGIPVLRKLDDSSNSLVIGHHFFNDKENRKIGSYLFSYCLEKNHYVNLPNFTFYTLVISNNPNSGNYGISTFRHTNKIGKLLNLIKFNSFKSNPKFVSLYFTGENVCSPIFLKQKTSEIKIKRIKVNVNCNKNDCICKNKKFKKSENNLKYAFLDPKDPN